MIYSRHISKFSWAWQAHFWATPFRFSKPIQLFLMYKSYFYHFLIFWILHSSRNALRYFGMSLIYLPLLSTKSRIVLQCSSLCFWQNPLYEAKRGYFEGKHYIFTLLPCSSLELILLGDIGSFKQDDKHLSSFNGCKSLSSQKPKKILCLPLLHYTLFEPNLPTQNQYSDLLHLKLKRYLEPCLKYLILGSACCA